MSAASRIVVTGSAGRIGSKVVRRLLETGSSVTGFDLKASGIAHLAYREVIGAFDDRGAAEHALEGASALLHLGAFMSWLPADADTLFRANVEGTRIILAAAAKAPLRRVIFASSGEVYPETMPDYQPIDEDHPLRPRSPYGLTKLIGEELVRFHERITGVPATILRFSHTQDAAELLDPASFFSGPRFFFQPKIRQQEGFGNRAAVEALRRVDDGQQALVLSRNQEGRPFKMHISDSRDMVEGILLALADERQAGRIFNLGATDPVDFADALPKMAAATGLRLHVVDLPGPGVFYHTSNARMREELGFAPRWTIDLMIEEAARNRAAGSRGGGTWTKSAS